MALNPMKMKHLALTLFLLQLTLASYSQNWLSGVGGAGNDEALDITNDGQGGFVISGFYSFGVDFNGTQLTSAGEIDGYVARTNSQGSVTWVKQFGGTGSDAAYANALDASGNIFVSGYFSGAMTVDGIAVASTNNTQDVFLAKLDPAGNLEWIETFGGTDHDFVYDLAVDQAGNAIITGHFKGTISVGPNTYNSVINPDDNEPSYDIFLVKYDTNGNVLWSKHGQAIYDDRGTGLAVNSNNEIALIGQFSDTLTLSDTYYNQVYNTGFVMMFDSDGDELWMRKMSASMCIPYDIVFHQDSLIYITGDFTGQLAVFTSPIITTTSAFQSKIFLTKMNTQGDVLWLENDGSDSQISSRAVEVDANGNAYVAGYFKCRLDEYSQQYGDGVFYSAGRRDVFIAGYSSAGNRTWERQFGGPGDDVAWDMVLHGAGQPVIAGAFSKFFHAPDGGNFLSTGWTASQTYHQPNSTWMNYCTDGLYGSFATIESTGHQDILVAKPVDLSREPYDFFTRDIGGLCNRDFLYPCINANCPDTIESCELVTLYHDSVTGSNGFIGPEYDILWSNGSTLGTQEDLDSGDYWLRVSRKDGCYAYYDTITVIVHPTPAHPLISDDVVINTDAYPAYPIFHCDSSSVHLSMSGVDTVNNTVGWSMWPGSITHPGLDTTVTTSGVYFANHISPHGCFDTTFISVAIDDWANNDTLDPHVLISPLPNIFLESDTLYACQEDSIYFLLIDSAHYLTEWLSMPYCSSDWTIQFPDIPYTHTHFDWSGYELYDYDTWMMGNFFVAEQSSRVIIDVELQDHCNPDTSIYQLHYEFYLHVSEFEVDEYGPHRMCPGDTVQIGINAGEIFLWEGQHIVGQGNTAEISITGPDLYEWTSKIAKPQGGFCSLTDTFNVRPLEAPNISMIPVHGVICPDDSVQLTAPTGSNYVWIGPNNAMVGSSQTIYASTPGFYFCEMINPEGCFLISNEVEIRGFNSPYMSAEPQQTICEGGTVVLSVVANEGSILDWPDPLIDNVVEQEIYQAGYYEVVASFCGINDTLGITVIDVSPEVDLNIAGFDTICASEILEVHAPPGYYSYEWNTGSQDVEIEITESGMYFLTAENFDGCIGHSDTFYVEVLPAPDPPLLSDTMICVGGSAESYAIGSIQSVYWFTEGLDSLGILPSITSDSLLESVVYYGAHYNGECFSFLDTASINLFEETGLPSIVGTTNLCPGDSLLLSTTASQIVTYSWLLPDSTIINGDQISLANPDSGQYTLMAAHPVCGILTATDTVHLASASTFSIAFLQGDSINCVGDDAVLHIPNPYDQVLWLPSQSIIDSILILENSEVWANVVDTNGCNLNTDTIHIQFQAPPSAITIPTDTACVGETLMLQVDSVYSLLLDDGQSQNPITLPFETSALNSDTTYIFLISDSLGCLSAPMNWELMVIQVPDSLGITGQDTLCEGETLTLSSNPANGGTTVFFDGFSDTLGVAVNGQLNVNEVDQSTLSAGVYATLNVDGCIVTSEILEVEVLPLPEEPYIIVEGPSCPQDTVLVYASDTTDLDFFWTGPVGFSSSENMLVFDPIEQSEQGLYTLRVELNGCSSDTSSVNIMIAAVPSVSLIPDTVICFGDIVDLILEQSYYEIYWSTDESSEAISVSDSGMYRVLVTNEFGCTATDSVHVETVTCHVETANVITPNGDGMNDQFRFEAQGLAAVDVKIFNRYGSLIYKWNTVDGAWDGTIQNSGVNASEGTYYFIGSYLDISGNSGIRKGYIQLLR